jgi:hypothetical protein
MSPVHFDIRLGICLLPVWYGFYWIAQSIRSSYTGSHSQKLKLKIPNDPFLYEMEIHSPNSYLLSTSRRYIA